MMRRPLAFCFAVLSGCAAGLVDQQQLSTRVHVAAQQCKAAPAKSKAKTCALAKVCQVTALAAATAIQQAQQARAEGQEDPERDGAAAGLAVIASTACKKGGW